MNQKRLSDREHVRKRPGMYIGDTTIRGLHHLAFEVLGNSIDQFLAGETTRIGVQIDGELVTISDDGPGLPFDRPSEVDGDSLASDYFQRIHRTPTADNHAPHVHFHSPLGLGLFLVSALSEELHVESIRDGKLFRQAFSRGESISGVTHAITSGPFFVDCNSEVRRGTRITFRADPEIFADNRLDSACLRSRILDATYLYPGLVFELQSERFCATGGLADLAKSEYPNVAKDCFYLNCETDGVAIQAAAHGFIAGDAIKTPCDEPCDMSRVAYEVTQWKSWANGVRTAYGKTGGTHEDAFREALAKVGWQPAVALIHVVMQEPRYAGPTRTLLEVPEKKEAMYSALLSSLEDYLDSNASESS